MYPKMDIRTQLTLLIEGLYYMSESDYPFEVLELGPEVTIAALVPEDVLLQMEPSAVAWQNRTPAEFFARMTRVADWMSEEEQATAGRFTALLDFVTNESEAVGVFKVGQIKVTCYIVGRACSGEWWALKTYTVET